jgi:hypothetical protein
MPAASCPIARHLLRLDQLALEALPVGDVDADQLDPSPRPVLDVAGIGEDRNALAAAREEVEIVAARVPALDRRPPERRGPRPLGHRVDLLERVAAQLLARVAEQPFRDVVHIEERALGRVDHEYAGRRAVDRAPVARLLLEQSLAELGLLREDVLAVRGLLLAQLLLTGLHEEVGDVEHALLELLAEEVEEPIGVRRIGCKLALQVFGEELREAHLDRQEARSREAGDEARGARAD